MGLFSKVASKLRSAGKGKTPDPSPVESVHEQETAVSILQVPAAPPKSSVTTFTHGLFILHPPPELPDDGEGATMDIVAVHGLNGKARDTWKDTGSGSLWLEDFLPQALPQARIMTFGYDSALLLSRSTAGIEDFARDLLNRLWLLRQTEETKSRPIILITHSLGGIVAKKALILAHENNHHYGNIAAATKGIVFMGTPHRGSDLVNWTSLLRNIVTLVSGTQLLRTDLVRELSTQSRTLMEISKQFLPRSTELSIMSFIELQAERPLTTLVVPEESARMELPNEMVFPVNAHHRNICRYPSSTDQIYVLVEGCIKAIASQPRGSHLPADAQAQKHVETATTQTIASPTRPELGTADKKALSTASTPTVAPRTAPSSIMASSKSAPVLPGISPTKQDVPKNLDEDTNLVLTDAPKKHDMVNIRIDGLRPRISATHRGWDDFSLVVCVPSGTKVEKLKDLAHSKKPEWIISQYFKFPGRHSPISNKWRDRFTIPVQVTSGRPCYKQSEGYKINHKQSIASFFGALFPDPVKAKILRYPEWMQSSTGLSHSVTAERENGSKLQISFMRTVRVIGDGNSHNPPVGLGTLPLFNTQPYRDRLPPGVAAQGGLFLPMYEMEAMWISFDCDPSDKFAIRPYFGGVNGISGQSIVSELQKRDSTLPMSQDYITLPDQKRLDGIAVSPGTVKQCVATATTAARREMPRSSSTFNTPIRSGGKAAKDGPQPASPEGMTIEWQMTGRDEVGGIQLQIIPQFQVEDMFAGSVKDACPRRHGRPIKSYQAVPESAADYDVLKTPEELNLRDGDFIHLRNLAQGKNPSRGKVVGDLLAEGPENTSDTLNLEVFRKPSFERILEIRDVELATKSVSFKVSFDDGFDDILAAARETFRSSSSLFHMTNLVANNPNLRLPVVSWSHLAFLTKPALDSDQFRGERQVRHLEGDDGDMAEIPTVDLALMAPSPDPQYVCLVDFFSDAGDYFSNVKKPCILEMSEESTVADLRRELETLSRLSTKGFQIDARTNRGLKAEHKLFGQGESSLLYSMPIFALDSGVLLLVKTLTGKTIAVRVAREETVMTVKEIIQDKEGIPPDQQRLIFGGKQLIDDDKIGEIVFYNIATIHLVLRLGGGGPPTVTVMLGETMVFDGYVDEIGVLKQKIYNAIGIFPHLQILTWEGRPLPDSYDPSGAIKHTLELTVRAQKQITLGIGAGGDILQEILADTANPRLWDVGNSKILNVHIVDSHRFRDITGLAPPDTPISWKTYSELHLPFDRNWGRENVAAGKQMKKTGGRGVVSADGAFDDLVALEATEEVESSDGESVRSRRSDNRKLFWDDEERHQPMVKLPGYPVVMLDVDQTKPRFHGRS